MKIKIICVGKLKEKYLLDGVNEYLKRIGRFADISVIEVPDEKIPDSPSEAQCEQIKNTEGDRILSKLKGDEHIFTLCIEGKQMPSEMFAEKIADVLVMGKNSIAFIIGGSLGLSDRVKSKGNERISFSRMTFPHQLMRLILAEQIYRAFKINANEKYHK